MAIFQADVIWRRVIELILKEVKEQPYVIQDCLSDFVTQDILSMYGQKEIDNAIKWFKDTEIPVLLPHRMDFKKMPCVTLEIGSSAEKRDLARLGDLTSQVDLYETKDIGKTIPYIVSPFTYTSYDEPTGKFVTPSSVNLDIVEAGMVVIDPSTGTGFVIASKDNEGFFITAGTTFSAAEIGILPQYRYFQARREISTFQETVNIGLHVHGDPSTLLWLHSLMVYSLMRYREGLLDANNFQISTLNSSDMVSRSEDFEGVGENGYSRFITITGQVENTWIKAPKHIIETVGASPVISIIDGDGNKIT